MIITAIIKNISWNNVNNRKVILQDFHNILEEMALGTFYVYHLYKLKRNLFIKAGLNLKKKNVL